MTYTAILKNKKIFITQDDKIPFRIGETLEIDGIEYRVKYIVHRCHQKTNSDLEFWTSRPILIFESN